MKKTVITVMALVFFCLLCGFTPRLSEMFDEADLFTAEEEKSLAGEAEQLAEKTKTEVVFLTYDDAEGKDTEQYTDDFCDEREFGYGGDEEKTFMMLAIDMDNREVYVKTGGTAIARVTDREVEYILDEIFVWMPEGSYYEAAEAFLKASEKALDEDIFPEASGAGNGYGAQKPGVYSAEQNQNAYGAADKKKPVTAADIFIRFLISAGIGGAAVGLMMLGRKTGSRPGSAPYMASPPRVLHRSDRYINTTVTKTRINTDNHSGSSGGGPGGSFHTSSGGNSYGGGGRSF
ncbi:MAG: hypothetical protein HFI89_14995 [Lachnospiraceae bacterium]|nr:hypothetical protein [Lachnospiraceae bacterium]